MDRLLLFCLMHVWEFERWQRKALSRRSMNELIYVIYHLKYDEGQNL